MVLFRILLTIAVIAPYMVYLEEVMELFYIDLLGLNWYTLYYTWFIASSGAIFLGVHESLWKERII